MIKVEKSGKPDNNNVFFIIEYILCFFMIYGVLWNKQQLASNAFLVSFITLIIEFIYINLKMKKVELLWNVLLIVFISGLFVVWSFIRNDKDLTFDDLREYFIFLAAIIYMFICCYAKLTKKAITFILSFNVFIGYLYIVAYRFAPRINNFSVGIDFNFGNPNFAGMWILQSLLYCTLAFLLFKSMLLKIIVLIPMIMLFGYMNETGARNCLLAYILFIAVCVWSTVRNKYKFPKAFVFAINILPIAFVPLYLRFVDPIMKKGWFNFLVGKGKNLNSRVKIWTHFLDKLGNKWLTGEYLTCLGNSHNSHMVILCSYGLIVLALSVFFTYKISISINNQAKEKRNAYCLAAFFATLFMGFGEGALFSGGIGLYIMACGFICLARYDFSDFDTLDLDRTDARYNRLLKKGRQN